MEEEGGEREEQGKRKAEAHMICEKQRTAYKSARGGGRRRSRARA